ncbi:MAG: hypothetical protein QM608_04180 [Caulobacter sp.]
MSGLSRANRRLIGVIFGTIAVAILGGIVGGVLMVLGRKSPLAAGLSELAVAGVMVVVMVMTLWLTARWWRAADEMVREAHKWAWYWGGSAGIAAGGVLFANVALFPASFNASLADATPSQIFIGGVGLCFLLQIAGYVLAWSGWWFARR